MHPSAITGRWVSVCHKGWYDAGMTIRQVKQRPVLLEDNTKRDVRTQFGAICWRRRMSDVQVLLVTSRRKRRWIIPKGWPLDQATPAETARTEAWEEAGAEGKVAPVCLGIFSYSKEIDDGELLPCVVAVFPLKVKNLAKDYPEKTDRRRKWFSQKKAAKLVEEPELATMIKNFDPSVL